MTRDEHLTHLVSLMAPPFREAWRQYCWRRAKELAKDPELADPPAQLSLRLLESGTATTKTENTTV
jgi:hypothetical protein